MANSQTSNEHLRESESLETSESPSLSRTISQDPDDLGLSTPHCLATGGVLRDCAPEFMLAADILASRASQFSFKTLSATRKSTSQDRYPVLSMEGNVPKISKPTTMD